MGCGVERAVRGGVVWSGVAVGWRSCEWVGWGVGCRVEWSGLCGGFEVSVFAVAKRFVLCIQREMILRILYQLISVPHSAIVQSQQTLTGMAFQIVMVKRSLSFVTIRYCENALKKSFDRSQNSVQYGEKEEKNH